MYPASSTGHNLLLGAPKSDRKLKAKLDRLVDTVDRAKLLSQDPIELVRPYADQEDQEVAAFLVSMLAYGRVASIKAKAAIALETLGAHPAQALKRKQHRKLKGFVYRFQRGDDLPRFLEAIRRLRKKHGSLGALFLKGDQEEPNYVAAMGRFIGAFYEVLEGPSSPGLRFLLPDPRRGGAAKRVCLFLRWVCRKDDGLDLGTWAQLGASPAKLVMPLDTHIHRISRYIGLTDRATADMKTSLEITEALAGFCPEDPLRYDMAICHLGIGGDCPKARDEVLCAGCPIQSICRLGG